MRSVFVLPLVCGLLSTFAITPIANAVEEGSPEYNEALKTAQALDELVRATRAYYTKMVVNKLSKEGTGAAIDSDSQEGYVPLPAQFIRKVTYQIVYDKRAEGDNVTKIALRSRWNLNDMQGLTTNFEKEGWAYLMKQQEEHIASGSALKKIKWQPYVKMDTVGGTPVIRYVSADPASASGCVSCHNAWEQKPEVMKLRRQQKVEEGKAFKKHELMGALAITIPIQE